MGDNVKRKIRPLKEPQADHVNLENLREAQNMTFDLKKSAYDLKVEDIPFSE